MQNSNEINPTGLISTKYIKFQYYNSIFVFLTFSSIYRYKEITRPYRLWGILLPYQSLKTSTCSTKKKNVQRIYVSRNGNEQEVQTVKMTLMPPWKTDIQRRFILLFMLLKLIEELQTEIHIIVYDKKLFFLREEIKQTDLRLESRKVVTTSKSI